MAKDEIIKRLTALVTCQKCQISGHPCDDGCKWQYEAGTMGEIAQTLSETIDLLKPPCEAHWIIHDVREQGYDLFGIKTWYQQIQCSKCGFIHTAIEGHTSQYNYCPECGAEMRQK